MSLLDKLPGRLQLAAVWAAATGLSLLLGWLRQHTDAEYAFASAIIVPVFLVARFRRLSPRGSPLPFWPRACGSPATFFRAGSGRRAGFRS
ncbi:MAG: hypothetical protein IPH30_17020 [Betaproteobacteria bacterium]|nr:hypothetical protein [Betaproteobacteria bacterium]